MLIDCVVCPDGGRPAETPVAGISDDMAKPGCFARVPIVTIEEADVIKRLAARAYLYFRFRRAGWL